MLRFDLRTLPPFLLVLNHTLLEVGLILAQNRVRNLAHVQHVKPLPFWNDSASRREYAGNVYQIETRNVRLAEGFLVACEFFFVMPDTSGEK